MKRRRSLQDYARERGEVARDALANHAPAARGITLFDLINLLRAREGMDGASIPEVAMETALLIRDGGLVLTGKHGDEALRIVLAHSSPEGTE